MTLALHVSHLRKIYRRGTVAVDDLSLDVQPGDFFGFLGPNGAGKSTTIHCITGIATPTLGHDRDFRHRCGEELSRGPPADRAVAAGIQRRYVRHGHRDHRLDGRLFRHARSASASARVDMLIEKFDLTQHAKKQFRELSGGLKRRVMLARALINDPKLLILDEPTAGVDVELRRDLWRYLQELNREGKTIFLTSHYLEEVERLCRTIAIVAGGKIVRAGTEGRILHRAGRARSSLSARPPALSPITWRRAA